MFCLKYDRGLELLMDAAGDQKGANHTSREQSNAWDNKQFRDGIAMNFDAAVGNNLVKASVQLGSKAMQKEALPYSVEPLATTCTCPQPCSARLNSV